MTSEAVHSLVDTTNEALLLYGYRRAVRGPDLIHPLGYGRELYFWSFIVALMIFGFGAGASLYQGWQHVLRPQSIEHPIINYVVLASSFLFEGVSWLASVRQLRATRGRFGYWEAIHRSKDPPAFLVLFEDSAALVGIIIAATGIYLSQALDMPILDGVASLLIGFMLALVATVLARESKSLLIGERASPALVSAASALVLEEPGVLRINGALTVHLAPDQILAAFSVGFEEDLHVLQIEESVTRIESRIRNAHPELVVIFIKPQTQAGFEVWRQRSFGRESAAADLTSLSSHFESS